MSPVGQIAIHVFRESVRDKVLYNLVAFALLMIATSILIGQLTAGQELKIIKDVGLGATTVFGLFIAVFIGIGLVSKEVRRRSVYSILSKPVRRHEVILGKYLGLVWTLAVNVGVMVIAVYVVLAYMSASESAAFKQGWEAPATDPALLTAFFLIFVQLMLVTAIALFFSTFTSPLMSAFMTLGLYVAGHMRGELKSLPAITEGAITGALVTGVSHVLPDLSSLDVTAQVVHGQAVSGSYVVFVVGYAFAYIAMLLLGAAAIFARRDLT